MQNIREMSIKELGQFFELSIINHVTMPELEAAVQQAVDYNMRGIFCAPYQIETVKSIVKGTGLFVGSGASFPGGAETPYAKQKIVEEHVKRGVDAVDFVMNRGAFLNGYTNIVEEEVKALRAAAPDIELRMIIECCFLTDEQIKTVCKIAVEGGLNYVKSSTGQIEGPSFEQACLIVDEVKGTNTHSKVAGVKFPRPQNAMVFLLAGIERIGSQQCVQILDGFTALRERGIF